MRNFIWFQAMVAVLLTVIVQSCGNCQEEVDQELPYEAATFEVEGETASMYGVIDHTTPQVVQSLIDEHPEVTTIVMIDVPGSDDDPANLAAARLVRARGFTTVVPSNGVIASGGVDFFIAGAERIVEPCAKFGVHSWDEDGPDGGIIYGNEVPRDDPSHTMFLDYYREMDVPEDFYWFTLDVAPAARIHWMSDEEILVFGLVTGGVR